MAVHLLEGVFFGNQQHPAARSAARAPAGPRLAVGRPDPRAEQPGRGRGAGDLVAARAGRRHAAQAGADRRRRVGPQPARDADRRLQERAVEQVAKAPELSPLEASDREDELGGLVRRARHRRRRTSWRRRSSRRASTSAGSTRSPPLVDDGMLEGAVRWLELHARDRAADERDRGLDHPDLDPGRPRPSSTRRWTARRTRCSTCTSCSTARWSCSAARSATDHAWSRTTTGRCRTSRSTPPS